jgi:hypothetical protein
LRVVKIGALAIWRAAAQESARNALATSKRLRAAAATALAHWSNMAQEGAHVDMATTQRLRAAKARSLATWHGAAQKGARTALIAAQQLRAAAARALATWRGAALAEARSAVDTVKRLRAVKARALSIWRRGAVAGARIAVDTARMLRAAKARVLAHWSGKARAEARTALDTAKRLGAAKARAVARWREMAQVGAPIAVDTARPLRAAKIRAIFIWSRAALASAYRQEAVWHLKRDRSARDLRRASIVLSRFDGQSCPRRELHAAAAAVLARRSVGISGPAALMRAFVGWSLISRARAATDALIRALQARRGQGEFVSARRGFVRWSRLVAICALVQQTRELRGRGAPRLEEHARVGSGAPRLEEHALGMSGLPRVDPNARSAQIEPSEPRLAASASYVEMIRPLRAGSGGPTRTVWFGQLTPAPAALSGALEFPCHRAQHTAERGRGKAPFSPLALTQATAGMSCVALDAARHWAAGADRWRGDANALTQGAGHAAPAVQAALINAARTSDCSDKTSTAMQAAGYATPLVAATRTPASHKTSPAVHVDEQAPLILPRARASNRSDYIPPAMQPAGHVARASSSACPWPPSVRVQPKSGALCQICSPEPAGQAAGHASAAHAPHAAHTPRAPLLYQIRSPEPFGITSFSSSWALVAQADAYLAAAATHSHGRAGDSSSATMGNASLQHRSAPYASPHKRLADALQADNTARRAQSRDRYISLQLQRSRGS